MTECRVCFRHCRLEEGQTGACLARMCRDGEVIDENYGKVTSLALDPIEKKPLAMFFPGKKILSVGSYGCNLRCPFCQNYEISFSELVKQAREEAEHLMPDELAELAVKCVGMGNLGVAYTYNEPLVGYEYVRDSAKIVRQKGLKNVVVTNGSVSLAVLSEILPYVDAMNIDLKGFTDGFYAGLLNGNRQMVMEFITEAAKQCHVELTCLIIPGENDSEDEMRNMTEWIAAINGGRGKKIPLHITRFFPRFHMTDRAATEVKKLYRLSDLAKEHLEHVFCGNI